ncbi:hypothetical protein E1B28_009866 [Marasmius oreades]|uniref:Rab-GAP TBC domain-containing protein n=1 Tax=Marasmius oreades TaxID=181124 RepID=A0A9P7US46_9AGAR|nr:uncharacterized protein E1B28_009866 [Marasmius oreades]KAG7090781.1 hypothetical protein E1B28_009866 [Marasmius oreades]
MVMDATELSRWTRFARKGGIGRCTAIHDCVAEGEQDLMFLKDDEITVLMQIPDLDGVYLGYCEGVVGRFQGGDVHFHSKLKKPVMTKRSSVLQAKSPTPSSASPPIPTVPPSPPTSAGRAPYTPLLGQSSSPIGVLSSSPPPMQVYQPPSRHPSARASEMPAKNHTTNAEFPEKEPSSSKSPLPSSHPKYIPTGSGTSVDGTLSRVSASNNSSRPIPLPSVAPASPAPSSHGHSHLPPTYKFPTEPSSPSKKRKQQTVPEQISSVDYRMSANQVEEEVTVEGELCLHRTASQSSSNLGYGGLSEDEALNPGTRFSTASYGSDDGQVGIGLSLMGALAGSDSDSEDDVDVLGRKKGTVRAGISFESDEDENTIESVTQGAPNLAHTDLTRPPTETPFSVSGTEDNGPPLSCVRNGETTQTAPVVVPLRSDSLRFHRDPSVSIKKPDSSVSSSSAQLKTDSPSTGQSPDPNRSYLSDDDLSPHPFDGDEWEGASDIYDNYRYSRYSRYSRSSVANSHRFSGVSINSTKGHRQVPSASTMPALPVGATGSPTSLAFSTVTSPTSPNTVFGRQAEHKEGPERDDSPVDPSVLSSSSSTALDDITVAEPLRSNIGMFGSLTGCILISTTTTSVVESNAEIPPQNANQVTSLTRSNSVASTIESHYSRDSESHSSPNALRQRSFMFSPARGDREDTDFSVPAIGNYSDFTPSVSPSTEEPILPKPSHLSVLEANAASFLRPENARLWQTTEKLNIVKTPPPTQETFPHSPEEEAIAVVVPDDSAKVTTKTQEAPPPSQTPSKTKQPKVRPTPLSLLSTTTTEVGASPLLHTRWGSPVSSTGMSSGRVSVYDESGSTFPKTPRDFDLSSGELPIPGVPAGTARMALEMEQTEGPYISSIKISTNRYSDMPLVVEDDEELPSHAKNHDSKDFEVEGNTTLDTGGGEKDTSSVSDSTYTSHFLDGLKDKSFADSTSQKTGLNALRKLVTSADDHRTPSPTLLIVQSSSPSSPSSTPGSPASLTVSSHSAGPPSPSPSAFPIPPTHQGDTTPVNAPSSPNPAHLRPQLVGDGERRSLFLPHPNAPKPPTDGPGLGPMGPLYQGGNSPQHPAFNAGSALNRIDPKKIAIHALRLALSVPPPPSNLLPPPSSAPIRGKNGKPAPTLAPPPPPPRGPTIYARVDVDLASANGPVPITFGIEPMGPPPLPPPLLPDNYNKTTAGLPHIVAPSPRVAPSPLRLGPGAQPETLRQTSVMKDIGLAVPRSPLAPPSPLKDVPFFNHLEFRSDSSSPQVPSGAVGKGRQGLLGRSATTSAAIPSVNPPTASSGSSTSNGQFALPRTPVRSPDGESGHPANLHETSSNGSNTSMHAPIPRANFTPQVGGLGMRPRSRSFTAFNSPPIANGGTSFRDDSGFGRARETSSSGSPLRTVTASEVSPVRSLTKSVSTPKLHVPSPLSIPANNKVGPGTPGISGPLASSSLATFPPPASSTIPTTPVSPTKSNGARLRKVTSVTSLESAASSYSTAAESSPPPSPITQRMPKKQSFQSMDGASVAVITANPRPFDMPPIPAGVGTLVGGSSDPETSSVVSARSQAVSPPPFGRRSSLRSKLSLPNMRRSSSRHDSMNSNIRPVQDSQTLPKENQTVQFEDMDFELVKPNVPFQNSNRRGSEESSIVRPGSMERFDQLRADSPAFSIASSGSRLTTGLASDSAAMRARANTKASDAEASMESHRQRELKWVSVMSSVPPSQSRKTKKVRKLIGEGVPASVRYLVWSHLTDCKAKNVRGVYTSFGKRARVAAFKDIEGDVRRCFTEYAHLQNTQGPVMALLQAYLTMVPDVPYMTGLTLIAGHLLLSAPEEDAFWIFVSIMDSMLRPYFSSSSLQMEVDAALFSRALEANDPPTAKKLLMDMSMNPTHICSPWFSTLFVGCLPTDYIDRVWDLFLYEGVPFLIRVGLAIVYCCRRALLDATDEETVLDYLRHPSPNWLPPSADAFITFALSFKVKDEEVRKQRIKMEAQVKRQAQQAPRSTGGAISFPKS